MIPHTLLVNNFRSLKGPHKIPLTPLTILIGENSSGKTAFLAAAYAALRTALPSLIRLQEEPFLLQTPQTIISEGSQAVTVGAIYDLHGIATTTSSTFTKTKDFWIPEQLALEVSDVVEATAIRRGNQNRYDLELLTPEGLRLLKRTSGNLTITYDLFDAVQRLIRTRRGSVLPAMPDSLIHALRELKTPHSVVAFAPLRMKPQRIYTQSNTPTSPSGEHVPQLLNTLLKGRSNTLKLTRSAITQFGQASGLFEEIRSKRIRTPAGEMFSLIVRGGKQIQTIQDVGYGISQSLPLIVDMMTNTRASTFLLQQPEVHLHPKSQVALASMLANRVKDSKCMIIVETHSDYIIDRIRVEVKRGTLRPEDVAIHFFRKVDSSTQIETLRIDDIGNIIDAPADYRSFFLRDQMELLGLE